MIDFESILKDMCVGNYGEGMWDQLSFDNKFRVNNRLRRYHIRRITDYVKDSGRERSVYYVEYSNKVIQSSIDRGELDSKALNRMANNAIDWTLSNTDPARWGWITD